ELQFHSSAVIGFIAIADQSSGSGDAIEDWRATLRSRQGYARTWSRLRCRYGGHSYHCQNENRHGKRFVGHDFPSSPNYNLVDRPHECRATEQRDKLAAGAHSITSSARSTTEVGRSRPSAAAVFRLTISSNRVGCSTGRSAGFAPL